MSNPSNDRSSVSPSLSHRWLFWLLAGLVSLPLVLALAGFLVLRSYDFDQLKPRLAQAVLEATGRKLTMGGPLELKVSLHPRLVLEDAALANEAWGSQPQMASIRRVEIVVEFWPLLTRRLLVVERLVLQGLDVNVEVDARGRSNLDAILPATAATLPAAQAPPTPSDQQERGGLAWFRFRRIEINQARLDWRRPGQAPLLLELKALDVEQKQESGPTTVQALGRLAQNDFDLRGQFQTPGQEGQPWPIKAFLRYSGAQMELEGQIRDPLVGQGLDIKLDLKVAEPARLGLRDLPGPWQLSGRLSDPGPQTYRLDGLELAGPAGTAQGWAQAGLEAERPKVDAELNAQALDLAPLGNPGGSAAAKPSPTGAKGGSQPGRVFSAAALPLELLQALDLNLKLRAGKLKMPRLELDEVDLNLTLSKGSLSLEPFKAKLAGGPADLRFTLTPKGDQAQAQLKLKLNQCQIGQVLRRAGAAETISGEMETQVDINGHGGSLAAIMASLDGKAVASVRRGRISMRHLGILGADLAGGIASALGEAVKGGESSALNCLVLGLLAKDGQATTTALALDSERLVMLGRGRVNLKTEELDLAMRPLPKSGLSAPGGVGLSLGQLVKPFKLTGTLAQPRITLDEAEALATLGKSLGGMAVMGPLGLAAGLASGGEGDSELCRDALAAANKGVPYEPKGGVTRSLERVGEGIGGTLHKLFGN